MPLTRARYALCLLLAVATPWWSQASWAATPVLEIRGLRVAISPFTVSALPGEALTIGLPGAEATAASVTLDGAAVGQAQDGAWRLVAPDSPGLHTLEIATPGTEPATLKLFVTVPADSLESETLNGYKIGPAPPGHPRHPDLYRPPAGFIEVTPAIVNTQLSPHFRLRQFLCKQAAGYPKYVVIQESLLLMLEGLLQAVNEAGYPAATFGVISGYRTPWYNKSIGNVANSRHVYGDAMDLYIDVDGDGRLDDLDGDGDHDREDVAILAGIAEQFMKDPANSALAGGVGRYGRTSRHGGFVHVDTRGYPARW